MKLSEKKTSVWGKHLAWVISAKTVKLCQSLQTDEHRNLQQEMLGNLSISTPVAPPVSTSHHSFSEGRCHCLFAQMLRLLCYTPEWQLHFLTYRDLWTSFQQSMSIYIHEKIVDC